MYFLLKDLGPAQTGTPFVREGIKFMPLSHKLMKSHISSLYTLHYQGISDLKLFLNFYKLADPANVILSYKLFFTLVVLKIIYDLFSNLQKKRFCHKYCDTIRNKKDR